MIIRPATRDDAAAINALYNPFILETPTTFETAPVTEAGRRAWIAERLANPRWPVVVADEGGRITGLANASAFDPRAAYETSVKVSVFVAPDAQGRGLGAKL